jgi:hypothetical protein
MNLFFLSSTAMACPSFSGNPNPVLACNRQRSANIGGLVHKVSGDRRRVYADNAKFHETGSIIMEGIPDS